MFESAKLIVGLLPILIDLIKTVEAAIPESGAGAAKLAAVRDLLAALAPNLETGWPAIEAVIGVLVKLFNATGIFKRDP